MSLNGDAVCRVDGHTIVCILRVVVLTNCDGICVLVTHRGRRSKKVIIMRPSLLVTLVCGTRMKWSVLVLVVQHYQKV